MLKALLEKRAKLVADMKAIIAAAEDGEGRELTAEEQTTFDGLKAEKEKLDRRIANADYMDGATTELTERRGAIASRAGITRTPAPEARREFETVGEFLHAVRFNRDDQRLNFVEGVGAAGNDMDLSAEMRMDNATTGGFLIPPQLRTQILSVDPQDALVRPRANIIPAGDPPDSSVTVPALDQTGSTNNMFGGVTVSWIAEGETKPETQAALRNITLTPHEVAGYMTITDKLLRNWQAADGFVRGLLRGAVNAAEDYAFLRGTGVNQPLGVINAGATYFVHRAGANAISYADLVNMVARLLMRGNVNSPIWSMPQQALPQIATMVDPEGHYIWQANSNGAKDGLAGALLGYPVRWNNRAPALGSKGDVILADWSFYMVKDGSGPFVAASEHVKFLENKTVIKIFWNVDGAPWLTAPLYEENGYQVSPFVGLDVP